MFCDADARTRCVVLPAPSEPMNFDVRLQRRNPQVVEVTWQPPQQTFGLVRGYKLVYFVPSDERVDSVEQRIGAELRSFSTSSLRKHDVIRALFLQSI